MTDCPIEYFTDNLVFNKDKSCWGVFSFAGYNYELLSNEEKIAMLYRLAKFLGGIVSEAKILMVPVVQDVAQHFERLRKRTSPNDPLHQNALNHNNETEDYLLRSIETHGRANDYKTYIIVKLQDGSEPDFIRSAKDIYEYVCKSPMGAINTFMKIDGSFILERRLERFRKIAKAFCKEQSKRIDLVAASVTEVQWLIRRMSFRGLDRDAMLFTNGIAGEWEPKADFYNTEGGNIIRPYKRDIANLFGGVIRQGRRCLQVENNPGEISYQTFLTIANLPESMEFPGCEWIYRAQHFNAQAEVCIHLQTIDYRQGLDKIEKKKTELNSQIEHIRSAHSQVPAELWESMDYADALEKEIRDSKSPTIKVNVAICLSANNPDMLEHKVAFVRQDYEDMGFIVERPLTDQLKLYFQCVPSVGVCVKDFTQILTPLALASGVIGASRDLGDGIGPFIGTTGPERKHVFLDLLLACLRNKSPVATLYGNLGYGKSFNANLLLYLTVLLTGGYGLIIDPKSERTHWVEELMALRGHINLVTLSPDAKYKGMMDPFNIYRSDKEAAAELAVNIVSEMLGLDPLEQKSTLLLEVMSGLKQESRPSMERLIELLDTPDPKDSYATSSRDLARALRARKNSGMLKLLFGNGNEQAINANQGLNKRQMAQKVVNWVYAKRPPIHRTILRHL